MSGPPWNSSGVDLPNDDSKFEQGIDSKQQSDSTPIALETMPISRAEAKKLGLLDDDCKTAGSMDGRKDDENNVKHHDWK